MKTIIPLLLFVILIVSCAPVVQQAGTQQQATVQQQVANTQQQATVQQQYPLETLAKQYKQLSARDVASYYKNLDADSQSWLGYYSYVGFEIFAKGCTDDSSLQFSGKKCRDVNGIRQQISDLNYQQQYQQIVTYQEEVMSAHIDCVLGKQTGPVCTQIQAMLSGASNQQATTTSGSNNNYGYYPSANTQISADAYRMMQQYSNSVFETNTRIAANIGGGCVVGVDANCYY